MRLDKQGWAEEKAAKGEAGLQQGTIQDAFAHFCQLRSARPRIVSPIMNTDAAIVSDRAQKFDETSLLLQCKHQRQQSRRALHCDY